jgi:hypothetical protein
MDQKQKEAWVNIVKDIIMSLACADCGPALGKGCSVSYVVYEDSESGRTIADVYREDDSDDSALPFSMNLEALFKPPLINFIRRLHIDGHTGIIEIGFIVEPLGVLLIRFVPPELTEHVVGKMSGAEPLSVAIAKEPSVANQAEITTVDLPEYLAELVLDDLARVGLRATPSIVKNWANEDIQEICSWAVEVCVSRHVPGVNPPAETPAKVKPLPGIQRKK